MSFWISLLWKCHVGISYSYRMELLYWFPLALSAFQTNAILHCIVQRVSIH